MPIQFQCACGQELQVQDQHAGARVRCPKCQRESVVPVRAEPITTAEPPPSPKASPVKASRDEEREEPLKKSRTRDKDDDDEDDRPRKRNRSRRDDPDEEDERDQRRPIPVQSSGMATTSLILGLVAFCFGALTGIPAVILGLVALIQINSSKGRLTGGGKAIAGVGTGLLFSVLGIVFLVLGIHQTRETAARMSDSNNLKQMSLATVNYEDTYGHLPGTVPPPDKFGNPGVRKGKPQLSWRVEILPFLEQENLYNQFHLDEPWDSPHNKQLIPRMPKVYAHPKADPQWARDGMTVYRVFTGPHCAYQPGSDRPIRLMQITDGTSNTIMIAESADPVIWTKPDEFEYDANKPLPKLGLYFSGGHQVAMFDASTRMISPSISERTLRNAITIDDGQVLGPDW